MNPISTGYKPEYGLGAVYQGINAADSEALNQEEIIKAYLANQREQQMQPLDVQTKQWDAASAQDKLNNPQYRKMALDGFIGQMQSQAAAGETAQLLAPFKRQTEQAQLGYDKGKLDVLRTIQDIDSKLRSGGGTDEQGNMVPFSPQDRATMEQLRQSHIADLANTPEFSQKQTLQNDRIESNEYIAQIKAQAAQKQLQEPKYKEQLAQAIQILADPNRDAEAKQRAQKFIEYDAYLKQVANPRSFTPTINMQGMGVPMNPAPVDAAPAQMPTPNGAQPTAPKGNTTIKYDNKGNRIP
jgi:hypothetical protein